MSILGIKVPTADDVRQLFKQAMEKLGNRNNQLTIEEFFKLNRAELNPEWIPICSGVEGMKIGKEVRLLRIEFKQFIDNHKAGQQTLIDAAIQEIIENIRLSIHGASVSFIFEFPPEHNVRYGKNVICSAKGVIHQ
jgi:hypothetical protein